MWNIRAKAVNQKLKLFLPAVLSGALFILIAAPASAGIFEKGAYLGFGMSNFSLESDHPSINPATGGGFQFILGRQFNPKASGEMIISGGLTFPTDPVPSPFYPADSAEYGYFLLGLRLHLLDIDEKRWTPWLDLGWVLDHSIMWDTYYYTLRGSGMTPYAGVDIKMKGGKAMLRAEVKYHDFTVSRETFWSSSSDSYNVSVDEYNLSVLLTF